MVESLTQKEAEQAAWDAMTDEEKVFHKLKTPPPKKDDWGKVVMPMIRRIVPNQIAHDICSVQPLTIPDATWPTTETLENKKPTK